VFEETFKNPPRYGPRARSGRLSAPSVSHSSKSSFYGAFVWVRRALSGRKWRFAARAVSPDGRPCGFWHVMRGGNPIVGTASRGWCSHPDAA
jgi:hypothetical protein